MRVIGLVRILRACRLDLVVAGGLVGVIPIDRGGANLEIEFSAAHREFRVVHRLSLRSGARVDPALPASDADPAAGNRAIRVLCDANSGQRDHESNSWDDAHTSSRIVEFRSRVPFRAGPT